MELIFNEQSAISPAKSLTDAHTVVMQYVQTYKEAKEHGFKKIRYEKPFDQITIAPNCTLNDFCNSNRTLGGLLLGLARHPFIKDNTPEEDRFIENNFFIDKNGCRIPVEGLGVAFLYKSIAISFAFDPFWKQIKHRLYVTGKEAGDYDIIAISHPDHCNDADFLEHKDRWKPVELVESKILPTNKRIHLRDDHGKDQLEAFAQRLCQSPYVIEIRNSIPYNPHAKDFIHNITNEGLIEIVLVKTDQGLGLVLQSTGRNKRETEKIANILKEKYS
ncbi:MAG: hypothetical protein K2G93_03085 [Rikenella sp.]|nr:hypothetical protein [Rikenella sp.]